MANDYIPRQDARFHARRNNFVTYVNGHLADWGLAGGVMGAEIRDRVAWVSRPRSCDPPPTPPDPGWPPQKTQSWEEERTPTGWLSPFTVTGSYRSLARIRWASYDEQSET
jgi:hypothetical protein